MNGRARLVAIAVTASLVSVLLSCGRAPENAATPTPGPAATADTTPTRRIIQSAEDTATARSLGLGGEIEKATATPEATTEAATPEATPTPAEGWRDNLPRGESLLASAPISHGVQDWWDLWLQPGSSTPGTNEVFMAEDAERGPVAVLSRTCNCADGGAAGIVQAPRLDVREWDHLYVWLVARVDRERGGNLANSNPRWYPEGAVQVRITYTTVGGGQAEWYHGFCYSDVAGADAEHFSGVGQGRWFSYLSEDLRQLSPRPSTIDEVRVYGFGWEFSGAVAEFAIVGSPDAAL